MSAMDDFKPTRMRARTAKHADLDSALFLWFKNARSLNIPISGPILQTKADNLAKMLGLESFLLSSGWLSRFKQWHGIHFRIISGESNAVTPEQTDF